MCLSMGPGVGVGVGEVHRAYIGQCWSTTARFFVFARNASLALLSLSSLNGIRSKRDPEGIYWTKVHSAAGRFMVIVHIMFFSSTMYLVIKAFILVAEVNSQTCLFRRCFFPQG